MGRVVASWLTAVWIGDLDISSIHPGPGICLVVSEALVLCGSCRLCRERTGWPFLPSDLFQFVRSTSADVIVPQNWTQAGQQDGALDA